MNGWLVLQTKPPCMRVRLLGKLTKQSKENDQIIGALPTKKTGVRHLGRQGRRRNPEELFGSELYALWKKCQCVTA